MRNWTVREAGAAEHDRVRLLAHEVMRESSGPKVAELSETLWRWQYFEAPDGALVVYAEDAGIVCGYYHTVICRMIFRGRPCLAGMVQDVGTASSHRRLGIFRAMGAFAIARMRERGVEFIYTFPNDKSLPSFVRDHQFSVLTRVPVYVAPLDAGILLESRLPLGWPVRLVGRLAGGVYRSVLARAGRELSSDQVVPLNDVMALEPLSADFATPTKKVSLCRDVRYLNWRFLHKPGRQYSLWGLKQQGRLLAYLVTRRAKVFSTSCLILMDMGCVPGCEDAMSRLIAGRMEDERAAGIPLAVTMGLDDRLGAFGRLGFVRVPEPFNPRPFNLLIKDLVESERPELVAAKSWQISLADWDVL